MLLVYIDTLYCLNILLYVLDLYRLHVHNPITCTIGYIIGTMMKLRYPHMAHVLKLLTFNDKG